MKLAIKQAQIAKQNGEVPVGSIIVNEGSIVIASAFNMTITLNDPTAHAEMLAIRSACKFLGVSRLNSSDIYVTLEPCMMCVQAISFTKIRRLYFGAYNPKCTENIKNSHISEIYGGLLEEECSLLLKSFFQTLR
ncbi:nucleoside deaminase [Wolbachia endosymbiont of Pentidionis agamae]|uniref:nucleoside deaminase n=1 Tax=Wolbachia endosymbiont of Pentidionis agamae TaxID=3110435 RepID=UPI002FD4EC5D